MRQLDHLKRDPEYVAAFTKAVDDDLPPEERAALAAAATRRRILLIAIAAVVVAAALAFGVVQWRRDTPAKQLARAKGYVQQGQHRSAVIELKRSLQEEPAQAEARLLLGKELSAVGDAKGAELEFRKALKEGYPAENVIVLLVRAVSLQGNYPEVIALVNDASAVTVPEVNAELQTMLGTAYLATGKSEAGMSALNAARELVPGFSGAAIAEARYLAGQGKFEAAAAKLAPIPPDDKRQAELQSLEGDIARALHRPEEAIVAYQAALKLDATDQETRIHLAQVYVDLNRLDAARDEIAIIVRAMPRDGRGQYLAAMVGYLRRDFPAAREAAIKALDAAPGNGKAQLLAGVILVECGELVEAENHLRSAIQSLDQSVEARRVLAKLYVTRLEPLHAYDALLPALGALPNDRDLNALNVRIALMKGDAVAASDLFERTAARSPSDVNTSLVSASLLFGAGKPDAAVARLNGAAAAFPDNAEIDAALLMTHLQMRRVDLAMADWRQLDRKKPGDARSYKLRSQIEIVAGDVGKARQSLERAATLDPSYLPAIADLAALDLREGHPDDARARLRAAIARQPRATEAQLLLAHAEEARGGKPSAAVDALAAARASDPKSLDVVNATVAFYVRQNDPAATLAAAKYGLTFAPNDQALLATVGETAQRVGKMDESLKALTRLTMLNAENADYAIRLGIVQLAMGQSEAALVSFRNGVKQAPRRTDLPGATVEAFLATGRTDEATRLLFDVASNWPARTPMIDELNADIKLAAKQYPEAIAAYGLALATAPSTRLAIKSYNAMIAAKQRGQAKTLLVDWQSKHPDDAAMSLFDAQVKIDAKDYGAAAAAYRNALARHPDDPTILNNLAWVLAQRNDPEALAYARKAVGLLPGNADAVDTLGWILVQQGMTQQGIDTLTQASALAPQKLDIRLRLAKAQIKGRHNDAARVALRDIADKAPDSAEGKESKQLLTTL